MTIGRAIFVVPSFHCSGNVLDSTSKNASYELCDYNNLIEMLSAQSISANISETACWNLGAKSLTEIAPHTGRLAPAA